MTVDRWLEVELVDDENIRILYQSDMKRVFDEFMLPLPDTNQAVISMKFREMVLLYGLTFVESDTDAYGEMLYVLPSQIKSIKFCITVNKTEEKT